MKIRLSFLKGISIICLSFFLWFLNCSKDVEYPAGYTAGVPIIDNSLTLELSFGADDSLGEFLLASPPHLAVVGNGDIIVSDEYRLKVFDTDGKPKQIVGGPGQGPGEFRSNPLPSISETGYLCVVNLRRITLFAPDYSLIDQYNQMNNYFLQKLKNEKQWNYLELIKIYCYTPEEWIAYARYMITEKEQAYLVLYCDGTQISIIDESERPVFLYGPSPNDYGIQVLYEAGRLEMQPLINRRIVYHNPRKHLIRENEIFKYTIVIHDLDSHEDTAFTHQYIPIVIPDSIINSKKYVSPLQKALKELRYYAPIQDILCDDSTIYVALKRPSFEKRYEIHVIDADTRTLQSITHFTYFDVIKKGYVYNIGTNDDGFYVVEKYRLDPAVYGK